MQRFVVPLVFIFALVFTAFGFDALKSGDGTTSRRSTATLEEFTANATIPEVTVFDAEGKEVKLHEAVKAGTLVTFWSSGCGECRIGLPIIEKFAQENSALTPLLINIGDDVATATEALKSYNVDRPTLFDRGGQAYQAWAGTLPSSYYIENGKIKYYFPGRIGEEHLNAIVGR